jgi:hypothetical protein
MNSSSLKLPLTAIALVLASLLLLDLAFDAPVPVYAAFVPALVWAVVLAGRERG